MKSLEPVQEKSLKKIKIILYLTIALQWTGRAGKLILLFSAATQLQCPGLIFMLHISHLLLLILPEELLASSISSFVHGMPGGTQLLEDWQDKAHPQEKQIVFSRMFETICHLLREIGSHFEVL